MKIYNNDEINTWCLSFSLTFYEHFIGAKAAHKKLLKFTASVPPIFFFILLLCILCSGVRVPPFCSQSLQQTLKKVENH